METTLKVGGMSCEHCAKRVKKAVEAVEKVVEAKVDLAKQEVCFTHDGADVDAVKNAIVEAGYQIL